MLDIKSIILADDDSDDAYIFQFSLKEISHSIQLEIVRDGNGLMNLLKHFLPDLIFLNLEIPYKNGLECLKEMQNIPALQNTPKIVFSSTNKPANIEMAYEIGAHLFMNKSDSFTEQLVKLSALFQLEWEDPEAVREQYCINGRYAAFM